MALAIKAIPTLYGDEARRFREMADETERKFDMRPKRDLTADPRYKAMRTILERSNIKFWGNDGVSRRKLCTQHTDRWHSFRVSSFCMWR